MSFYRELLGFEVEMHPGPGFAALSLGGLRLLLSATTGPGGGSQAAPDGRKPEPGGWNRIQLQVDDLDSEMRRLDDRGGVFRGDIVIGRGGRQILLEDPSGNLVELFEPAGV